MSATTDSPRKGLIVPALGRLYAALHDVGETILRAVAGIFLAILGSQKITNPFGAAEMVEGLGFYPGALWSPLLACTEFFGGIVIAIGLLARPAAFACLFVLLATVWFHWVTMGRVFRG